MPTAYDDVAHLLRRVGFGGTAEEVRALTPLSLAHVVDRVLDVSSAPPAMPPAIIYQSGADYWARYTAMVRFWTERMRTSPCPIAEKMTLFWHGHFCSSLDKVAKPELLMGQNQLFRRMGMGNFGDLAKAVAVDPAMLVYLDNATSKVGKPNENFARELMELFTLGVGRYGQEDVVASARAWTGHGLDDSGNFYEFHPSDHDYGPKTFLGKTANWDGPAVIDEIVHGGGRTVCASFVTAKLWGFLAYPNPEPALVNTLASTFAGSGMNITALLRAILNRPEFYSPRAKSSIVRSPVDFVVAALRYAKATSDEVHPEGWFAGMGQEPYKPPNVAGWRGNAAWLSTAGMWRRQEFARALAGLAIRSGVLANPPPASVPAAVQRAFDAFGITAPSGATRAAFEAYVARERISGAYAEQVNLITLALVSPDFNLA